VKTPPLYIRPGTLADLPALASVTTEAINVDTPSENVFTQEENLSDLEERSLYPGFWSHVAIASEKIVGFAAGYPGDWRGPDHKLGEHTDSNYLWLLMVRREHWGKQIGTRLLDAVTTESRAMKLQNVNLYTRAGNVRAQQLYERYGYASRGEAISQRQGAMVRYTLALDTP
jgi:ribosomal protein S18 acetylase RimI-like enzyme